MVPHTCSDPGWMESNTFYPAGTTCYRDPSCLTCVMFGNSGSGVVRSNGTAGDATTDDRFSYVGPMSLYKGCDRVNSYEGRLTYGGENVGIVTDAYCFLEWVADQYNMTVPGYQTKPSCNGLNVRAGTGDPTDKDRTDCLTKSGTKCDFTGDKNPSGNNSIDGVVYDRCKLYAQEGYAYIMNVCKDTTGTMAACKNNCIGVRANDIVAGGLAVYATSSLAVSYTHLTLPTKA